jgi:uncharacterized glyoxalase superfamily protein PhnB
VSFNLGAGSSKLALYTWGALARDAGVPADGSRFRGITLNYIVPSPERVDEVMAQAERAGAQMVKPVQKAQWGGYSGHFSDPDGNLWKVAADAEYLS